MSANASKYRQLDILSEVWPEIGVTSCVMKIKQKNKQCINIIFIWLLNFLIIFYKYFFVYFQYTLINIKLERLIFIRWILSRRYDQNASPKMANEQAFVEMLGPAFIVQLGKLWAITDCGSYFLKHPNFLDTEQVRFMGPQVRDPVLRMYQHGDDNDQKTAVWYF